MNTAIETRELTKIYEKGGGWRRRGETFTAVSKINLSIPAGELFGLLGPNGAGKTTLVKMLCALILPSAGDGRVAGYPLTNPQAIRAAIGLVVTDERSFHWRLSARRNLEFFAAMYGLDGRTAQTRVNQLLADVDLLEFAERPFSKFSSGMRQRLAIARSLLHQPRILFLDEPTRSLDPIATQRLHDLILRLMAEREMTVFLITHDLAEAEKLCRRVALMHKGEIQAVGKPDELRGRLRPYRAYKLETAALSPAAIAALTAVAPDLEALNKHTLSFRAKEEDGVLTAVLDALRAQNLPIHNISAAPPSLEEVFAYFTKESDQG